MHEDGEYDDTNADDDDGSTGGQGNGNGREGSHHSIVHSLLNMAVIMLLLLLLCRYTLSHSTPAIAHRRHGLCMCKGDGNGSDKQTTPATSTATGDVDGKHRDGMRVMCVWQQQRRRWWWWRQRHGMTVGCQKTPNRAGKVIMI